MSLIGLVPAAGRGSRFAAHGPLKELYPLRLRSATDPRAVDERPLCALAIDVLRAAGVERVVVVISPEKTDVVSALVGRERSERTRLLFGSGPVGRERSEQTRLLSSSERARNAREGPSLAYVVQPDPHGVPQAVRLAAPWLGDRDVALVFPDAVHFPEDALGAVCARRVASGADVVLGVFPAAEPERLGPVEMRADGSVVRIYDKPGDRRVPNAWGLACWSPRFTTFCATWEEQQARQTSSERALGHAFEAARAAGLRVEACFFADGAYADMGTPAGLAQGLALLRSRRRLADADHET